MFKVLDLFAGTQSVRKALDDMGLEYDYVGLDIYSPEKFNIKFDLTQDNVVEELQKILGDWKPDFIWSSPVCNQFSTSTGIRNGTIPFVLENKELRLRTTEKYYRDVSVHKIYRNSLSEEWINKYKKAGAMALKMHINGKKIIDHFNVPFAIENPATAYSKYLYKEYIPNACNYCMYGFEVQKRTNIYSNKLISLELCNHKEKHSKRISGDPRKGDKVIKSYAQKSAVPPQLIKDIISQLMEGK